MKNKTIIWYVLKYFVLISGGFIAWQYAAKLATERDDLKNLIGYALFTGIVLTIVLTLKSEFAKLSEDSPKKNIKNKK